MNNINLHKNKLYAGIIALIAFIALFLPWFSEFPMDRIADRTSTIGFAGIGVITILGIGAVLFASLTGNKMNDYDANGKKIVLAGFGLILLIAVISLIAVGSRAAEAKPKSGFGVWLSIIAGLAGLVIVSGIVNKIGTTKTTTNPSPPPPSPQ